jgi:uncharacterized protein DUF835
VPPSPPTEVGVAAELVPPEVSPAETDGGRATLGADQPVAAEPPAVEAPLETPTPAETIPPVPPIPEAAPPAPEREGPDEVVPVTEVVESPSQPEVTPQLVLLEPPTVPSPPPSTPPTPPVLAVETPAEPEPPPTGVELTIGDSLVASLGGFLESTAAGHHGVCVVRESPERIRARVGSRPIEVFWLTNIGRGPALRPSDLEGAFAFLARKLLEERVTAFFLEGIEYLVRLHGADAVLNGLVEFDRLARENDARIWVCIAPALMKPDDLERFRSTFGGGTPVS